MTEEEFTRDMAADIVRNIRSMLFENFTESEMQNDIQDRVLRYGRLVRDGKL